MFDKDTWKLIDMKKLLIISFAIFVLLFGCINQEEAGSAELDVFAKCLKDSGLKLYSSYICSVCEKQEKLFGASLQHVDKIECHPNGPNPQTQLCIIKNIEKTPTWIIEKGDGSEIQRLVGYQSLENLASVSGCRLEVEDDG
jgi:thioredoxin-related protein